MQKELKSWQIGIDGFLVVGGLAYGLLGTYNSFLNLLNGEKSIP
jgi:hypothetical protein